MLKKTAKCSKLTRIQNFVSKHKMPFSTDATFKKLTTVGIGGKIALTVFPKTPRQLKKILRFTSKLQAKTMILGGGSNILASDDFFDGVVICTKKLNLTKRKKNIVLCQAGTNTVHLANKLADFELSGGEYLFCLPATLGGAVAMNAGCFGMETQNIVDSVKVFDKNGKAKTLDASKCNFGYRNSIFLDGEYVIVWVKLKLNKKNKQKIIADMQAMFAKKRQSQPLKEKSMGCVFFNNAKTASMLIDKAGLKGVGVGGAVVSKKHAGFLLNQNQATSADMVELMQIVKQTVFEKFNETLFTEVRLTNFE